MRRHRFDPISLVFGLVFVTAAGIVLGGGSLVDDGRFLVPATLLGLGVALLAHTATRSRSVPDPAAVSPADPGTYWSTPDQTDYVWSWDRTPTGTAATSEPHDAGDVADAEDGAGAPEPDTPGSSAADADPPAAPSADTDLADLPEADAISPADPSSSIDDGFPMPVADLDGPDLPGGSDARVADDSLDASGDSSPGSAHDSDVTAAEVTVEEPESVDPDAGLHDPTVEEPTVEEPAGPQDHDAWVWQRVESSEDGRPTWIRRPDTDDPQDEDSSPG